MSGDLVERLRGSGPYTCCQCTAATWNDDDWCNECVAEAQAEIDRIAALDAEEALRARQPEKGEEG